MTNKEIFDYGVVMSKEEEEKLRDDIAKIALQCQMMHNPNTPEYPKATAKAAYRIADAMLEARKKE